MFGKVWAAGLSKLYGRCAFWVMLSAAVPRGCLDKLNVWALVVKSKFAARGHGPADSKKKCQCGRAGVLSHKFPETYADDIFIIQQWAEMVDIWPKQIGDDAKECLKPVESVFELLLLSAWRSTAGYGGPLQNLGQIPRITHRGLAEAVLAARQHRIEFCKCDMSANRRA